MRNRMSSNQMAEWIHHDDYNLEFSQDQLIDEYFDCMIDCNDNYCRKVCTEILRSVSYTHLTLPTTSTV